MKIFPICSVIMRVCFFLCVVNHGAKLKTLFNIQRKEKKIAKKKKRTIKFYVLQRKEIINSPPSFNNHQELTSQYSFSRRLNNIKNHTRELFKRNFKEKIP